MRGFSFLASHLKAVFVICLLLLVVSGGVFAYFFIFQNQIKVVNQSNYYTVTYTPTNKFIQLINEWGVWSDKNALTGENEDKISHLEFVFLDDKQEVIVSTFENIDVWSTSFSLTENNTHQIKVYVNPQIFSHEEVANNKNRNIDRIILSAVLETLYQNTHSLTEIRENTKNFTTEFKNDEIPFSIKLTESR